MRIDSLGEAMPALKTKADEALSRFEGIGRVVLLTHGPVEPIAGLSGCAATGVARNRQSVYTPAEVKAACALPGVEMLQVPGNVLDQRALLARGAASVVSTFVCISAGSVA